MRDQQVLCTKTSELRACKHDRFFWKVRERGCPNKPELVKSELAFLRQTILVLVSALNSYPATKTKVIFFMPMWNSAMTLTRPVFYQIAKTTLPVRSVFRIPFQTECI
jgi:hypothetical protein